MVLANMRPQGLACPECSTRIVVDITQLLAQGKITCPMCHLELIVDQRKSADSLNALREFQDDFKDAQMHFSDNQYSDGQPGSKRNSTKRREPRRRHSDRRRRTRD